MKFLSLYILTGMFEEFLLNLLPQLLHVGTLIGDWLNEHLVNILAILVGAWIIRRFGAKFIARILKYTVRNDLYPNHADREKRMKTLNTLASAIMRVGVYIVVAILLVGEINPSYTTALFASAGLIGVALGFGAKDLINDLVSGIFIITENQYRVGDVIEIGGVSGTVEDITIRTTVLRDLGGDVHHIPNGTIKLTTNMTLGFSGIDESIVVGYDTDIDRLKHIINHVGEQLASDAEFQKMTVEPIHFLRVDGFGDNGIIVRIAGKTASGEQWLVKGELYERLYKEFKRQKIEIPYQHITLDNPSRKK